MAREGGRNRRFVDALACAHRPTEALHGQGELPSATAARVGNTTTQGTWRAEQGKGCASQLPTGLGRQGCRETADLKVPLEQVCVSDGAIAAVAAARPDAGVRRVAHLLDRPQGAVRRLDAAAELNELLWVVWVKAVPCRTAGNVCG